MELPIQPTRELTCMDCTFSDRVINKDEFYCKRLHEVFPRGRKTCKGINAKPPEKPEPPPVPKEEPKPEETEISPERTIYVFVPREKLGKIIGREGRNIRTLERLTDVTITTGGGGIHQLVGPPVDVEIAAKTLWALTIAEKIHPMAIRNLLDIEYGKRTEEDQTNYLNRSRAETRTWLP